MFTISLALNIIAALALFIIGLLVFIRDKNSQLNRVFFLFSLSLIAWIFCNYFSNQESYGLDAVKIANNLVLLFAGTSMYIFVWFVALVSPATRKYKNIIKPIIAAGFIISLTTLTPAVVKGIEKQDDVYAILFGPLAPLYFVSIIAAFVVALFLLILGLREAKGADKSRLLIITVSIIATVVLALATNVFIPLITGSFALTNIGPLSTLFLAAGIAYSIVKHKLFDIRVFVARSLGYLFSIVILSAIYAFITFVILNGFVFEESKITIAQEVLYTISAVFLIFTFQPIKRNFDKLSTSIFYRDAYDGQEFLNTVNAKIVTSSDLYALLNDTATTIKSEVKLNFCNFYIDSSAAIDFHTAGTNTALFAHDDWHALINAVEILDKKVITAESIEVDEKTLGLMRNLGVELVLKMTSKDQDVGYLILSDRRSGTNFGAQDVQILEIIADEVAIAVQNAVQFEQIAQFNITLQKKIEDATSELQKSNEKLKALDEAKDEFISMASHQLRTPLTSVKGYISMVLEGDAGDVNDNQKKFLDQAYLSSQRMVYLIADLLNVSRLKTGKFVIEAKPTNIPDMVESEIAQLYETAKARDLQLVFKKPDTFPLMNIDETKTRQVIMNFADNAIYYTPTGGRIVIALKATKSAVEFTVTDSGIGVPKSDQHHLFTKFYRAGNAKKARPDGTGLGLFMAKKVIVAQGGAIIFKTTEGKGSTFGFSFPRNKLESS